MRIAPIMLNYTRNNAISTRGNSLSKQNALPANLYVGDAGHDLAYASLLDKKIAQDLKLMGLI